MAKGHPTPSLSRASHPTPFCVIAHVGLEGSLHTKRVPEAQISRWQRSGWSVLIRDSEMRVFGPIATWRWQDVQSGPLREYDDGDGRY